MIDLNASFPTRSLAPDENYQNGSARNVTTSGDGTGTPWTTSLINDVQGFFQRVTAMAGITASNNSETALVSQVFDGIRLAGKLPGEIIMHNMTTIPSGYRILNLQGQGIPIGTTYTELDAACYCGDANNADVNRTAWFHADDAAGTSRNTAGAYLILPDFRGRFARGEDIGATVDPDGASRFLGDGQADALQKHNHVILGPGAFKTDSYGDPAGAYNVPLSAGASSATLEASAVQVGESISGSYSSITGVGRVSTETRPSNVQVQFAVCY